MEETKTYAGTSLTSQIEDFLSQCLSKEITKFSIEYHYPDNISLDIDWNKIDRFSPELAEEAIEYPYKFIEGTRNAILDKWIVLDKKPEKEHIIPRIFNLPEQIQIRKINASLKDKLVAIEGILTRTAEAKIQICTACFECRRCGRLYRIFQTDRQELKKPLVCACEATGKNAFSILPDDSSFKDTQKMEIQEPLEILSGGEEAQKIVMWADYDIVNMFKVGQRVVVTGILKGDVKKASLTEKYLEVVHIQKLEKDFSEVEITPQEKQKIMELSKDPNLHVKIRNSIAPSIYGHEIIKDTLALVLFGGAYTKANKQFRPDIHILLIGDPGLGKTALVQQAIGLSPIHIYVSGKSATGAGLTVTCVKDDFGDGGYTIKAGATVLGCGGIVAIDEFDKITDIDKASLHEIMETQTVSLAKGGVVATFKANPSIIAIANPKGTRFDPYEPIGEQFNVPPSLLSRFDVILPFKEGTIKEEKEKELVDFIYETREKTKNDVEGRKPDIDLDLLRKYIAYARKNIIPDTGREAKEIIKEYYIDLRKLAEKQKAIPATPRQLEALMRLSEASAKMRLSNKVERQDADRAIEIMRFFLREIGTDSETGEIDIGILYTGTTCSKIEKTKIIFNLLKESPEHTLPEEDMIKQGKDKGLSESEIMEAVTSLMREGSVAKPRAKTYRAIVDD